MIEKKNDFLFSLQKKVIQEMQQKFQWGSLTIPSFKGDFYGVFEEADTIMAWAKEVIAALEDLKEIEPEEVEPEGGCLDNNELRKAVDLPPELQDNK